jgi:hypothetical protein
VVWLPGQMMRICSSRHLLVCPDIATASTYNWLGLRGADCCAWSAKSGVVGVVAAICDGVDDVVQLVLLAVWTRLWGAWSPQSRNFRELLGRHRT